MWFLAPISHPFARPPWEYVQTATPAIGTGCPPGRTVMADSDPVTTSPIQTATATLHTNRGDIKIALFGNHAP
jgi:hypothetical protein